MKVTENSFTYCESKYTPSSILIFGAYLMAWYLGRNKIPISIHIYNLSMSLYDRYTFPSRGDKILKFLKTEYDSEGQKYCFKSIQKDYGVSIIDIISVVGIMRLLFKDTSQIHHPENNSDHDIKDYMLYTVLGLTGLQMISGNPVTSVKVEYESVEENFLEEEHNDYINGDDVYSITSQDISASY